MTERATSKSEWGGLTLVVCVCTSCLFGCATWGDTSLPPLSELSNLPAARSNPDSVSLEVAFVRVPLDFEFATLWREIDEQPLAADLRQSLLANGLRTGVLGPQIPKELHSYLATDSESPTRQAEALAAGNLTSLRQVIQSDSGERSELIVVPETGPETVVMLNESNAVRAERFAKGQAIFALRTYPAGDGTVQVELTPELQHGETRHQWAPGNGTFRHDYGREEQVFEQFRFSLPLRPGQTLLVTATDDLKGLGNLYFGPRGQTADERRLLLIRLARTQTDDRFSPESQLAPLASPLD